MLKGALICAGGIAFGLAVGATGGAAFGFILGVKINDEPFVPSDKKSTQGTTKNYFTSGPSSTADAIPT